MKPTKTVQKIQQKTNWSRPRQARNADPEVDLGGAVDFAIFLLFGWVVRMMDFHPEANNPGSSQIDSKQ